MRVQRSFGFIDLCGFTRFTEAHGDEQAVDVLTRFRAEVREMASEHAVRVDKWLGDGVMLVSTDEARLLEAVLALMWHDDAVDVPLPLRGGIAGGRPVVVDRIQRAEAEGQQVQHEQAQGEGPARAAGTRRRPTPRGHSPSSLKARMIGSREASMV